MRIKTSRKLKKLIVQFYNLKMNEYKLKNISLLYMDINIYL